MTTDCAGFFTMWNGMAPEVSEAFQLAHARDHLADHLGYLGENGILWARRHNRGVGTLPPNFALYGMADLSRLTDPADADRRVPMSDWFRNEIRPKFRDRIAHHSRVLASAGAGAGGAVATWLTDLTGDGCDAVKVQTFLERLLDREAVTAAHLGLVDWTVPNSVGQPLPVQEPGAPELGVLIVESFDRYRLSSDMPAIFDDLLKVGLATAQRGFGHYDFSYALNFADLAHHKRFQHPG